MNWYLTKIIFRIICGDGDHTPQFDEQLRLIEARNEEEAFAKAQTIGVKESDAFMNAKDQLVQWKFINIAELYRLHGFIDGAEMYSRIYETDNADDYIKLINLKAENIQSVETHKLLQLL
jgi:hypothetical protein